MMKKRILIADDHPIVRAGIEKIVGEIADIELVASCVDGIDALHSIKKLIPDVAILDLAMPGMNGLEVIRKVRDLGLHTEFIILTMYADDEYFQTAVDEGVKGYLLKDETRQELKNCIQQVLSGKVYFKPKLGSAHNG
jgi:DNA-binding NarL/FixJ family response regulator